MFNNRLNYGWFALALSFLGLYLLKKSMLMKSDSSLWLAILFIGAGFSIVLSLNIAVLNNQLLLLFSISVALASLVVYLTWQNEAHLYLFITTIISVVPTMFYSFRLISLLWFILAVVLVNLLNFILYRLFVHLFAKT